MMNGLGGGYYYYSIDTVGEGLHDECRLGVGPRFLLLGYFWLEGESVTRAPRRNDI